MKKLDLLWKFGGKRCFAFPIGITLSPRERSGGKRVCSQYHHEVPCVFRFFPNTCWVWPELRRSLFSKLLLYFMWTRLQSALAVWDSSRTLSGGVRTRVEDKKKKKDKKWKPLGKCKICIIKHHLKTQKLFKSLAIESWLGGLCVSGLWVPCTCTWRYIQKWHTAPLKPLTEASLT